MSKSPKKAVKIVTNAMFAKTNEVFIKGCADAGVEPTRRQAGKWRRKTGRAYQEVMK